MVSLDEWKRWRGGLPALALADVPGQRKPRPALRAELTAAQGGLCALCLTGGLVLVLDHEHSTGLARGMLCRPCNTREGITEPGADPVTDAYRSDPPAAGSGWGWTYPQPGRPAHPAGR